VPIFYYEILLKLGTYHNLIPLEENPKALSNLEKLDLKIAI